MKQRTRKKPQERKEEILAAAAKLAERVGYTHVTRDAVADQAGVSMGLVSNYFSTMAQLKRDIMRFAVREGNLHIIAQGLMHKDTQALKVDKEVRNRAAQLIAQL